jgi:hypothetical protein
VPQRLRLRLLVAGIVVLAAVVIGLTTRLDSSIYKLQRYGGPGADPQYDVSVDRDSLHRAGQILSRDGGTYFVYTPANAPVLHGNIGAAIRLWALPALPLAAPDRARWVFSYKTARLVPPGLQAGRVYGVGPHIALVQVAR